MANCHLICRRTRQRGSNFRRGDRRSKAVTLAASSVLATVCLVDVSRVSGANPTLGFIQFSGGTYTQDFNTLAWQSGTAVNSNNPVTLTNSELSTPASITYTLPATVAAPSASPATFSFSDTTLGGGTALATPNTTAAPSDPGMDGWWGTAIVIPTGAGKSNATVANRYAAQEGSQTTGGQVGFGTLTSSNRALGLISTSTTGATSIGLALENTSASTITQFTLSYTGELWRQQTVQKYLHFGYAVTSTNVASNSVGAGALPTSGTTPDANLDVKFATGASAAGTSGPIATSALSDTLSGITWAPNTTLWLTWQTWNDANGGADASGSAQGVALDNLQFSINSSGGGGTPVDTWNVGAALGKWDTTTKNFNNSANTAIAYTEGDAVIFPDTLNSGGGTINVTAPSVSPASVQVSNNSGTYTITGNPINGSGALTKSGNGTLILSPTTTNGYTGGTNVNGGQVIIAADAALGAPAGGVAFNGGTLALTSSVTSARMLTFSGAGTLDTGANTATFGGGGGTGSFTKLGSGNLTITGSFSSGPLTVSGGNLIFTTSTGAASVNPGPGGTAPAGNIVLAGPVNFNVVGSTATTTVGSLAGIGSILVQSSSAAIHNLSSTTATINNNIVLNSSDLTGASFTRGDVKQAPFASGSFATVIGGATALFGVNVNGVISGFSDVVISNDPKAGGGSGILTLNQPNTYQGTTVINMSKGQIVSGANNALPSNTDIIIGGSSSGVDGLVSNTNTGTVGVCSMDLAGHNQQISSISDGDQYVVGGSQTGAFSIVNSGQATSTFTVSGSTNPANGWSAGSIGGGATNNNINLVKGGSNTLVLNNVSSYTGSTTVRGGTLSVGSSAASQQGLNESIASTDISLQGIDSHAALALYSSTALANGSAATISVITGGSGAEIDLNYSGQQALFQLAVNGVAVPNGIYGASSEPASDPSLFAGTGTVNVVPEPATVGLLVLLAPTLMRRRRVKNTAGLSDMRTNVYPVQLFAT